MEGHFERGEKGRGMRGDERDKGRDGGRGRRALEEVEMWARDDQEEGEAGRARMEADGNGSIRMGWHVAENTEYTMRHILHLAPRSAVMGWVQILGCMPKC